MTEFTNEFSKEVWEHKYRFGNESTVDDTFLRVAKALASIEKDKDYWADQFYSILQDFQFVPGGRILSNAGTGLKNTTLINCYVHGFDGEDQDSLEGIYTALYKQAKTLASEGGYGFCANVMRPRGAPIKGIGNQTPGAIKFLELWDKSSEIITCGSGKKAKKGEKIAIRKGAQLVSLGIWHPDIIEFIKAKQEPGRLTKFNISVLVSDRFMHAVDKNENWDLMFPNYEKFPKLYKDKWDGNEKKWFNLTCPSGEWSEGFKIYDTLPSKELWELLMQSTYSRNDPGVLFADTINRMNNLYYCEYIDTTNPCAEQVLPKHSLCNLGSINLTHFIKDKNWDYNKLKKFIPIIVRILDNVNDVSNFPLKEYADSAVQKRRIGCGIFGYASALMMMKVKYGSPKALRLTEELMSFYVNELYMQSSKLAKEKCNFPLYDQDKYLQSEFIKSTLNENTIKHIKKYGMRNSHLLSIQPTGNTAVLANLTSSGIEPIFSAGYIRTAIQNDLPDHIELPKNVDWAKKKFDCKTTQWQWAKEGTDNLLHCEDEEGNVYKYDSNRGLTKEEWVEDYAVTWLKNNDKIDNDSKWYNSFINDLSIPDHIKTLSVLIKYVCSAISKTINFPNNYPYEDFKNVYRQAWENGIKGITTYRTGTMTSVLSTKSTKSDGIEKHDAIKRPKELPCDVHHISVKGQPYFVLVGKLGKDPYEIFAGKNGFMSKKIEKGKIIKRGSGKYRAELDDDIEISPVTCFSTDDEDVVTRLTSSNLRHGVDIKFIVGQLKKSHGDLTNISKGIARVLSKYIEDGTEVGDKCPECGKTLVYMSRCPTCVQCSYSACA